jgi:hypothetical protein
LPPPAGPARLWWRRQDTAWDAWRHVFDSGNALGTVAQSGGLPTGALVERGNNANGSYMRLADGTQICWQRMVIKPAADASSGIKSATWTFPAAFVLGTTRLTVQHMVVSTNPSARGQTSVNGPNNTSVVLYYNEAAGTASDVSTLATAVGNWI